MWLCRPSPTRTCTVAAVADGPGGLALRSDQGPALRRLERRRTGGGLLVEAAGAGLDLGRVEQRQRGDVAGPQPLGGLRPLDDPLDVDAAAPGAAEARGLELPAQLLLRRE